MQSIIIFIVIVNVIIYRFECNLARTSNRYSVSNRTVIIESTRYAVAARRKVLRNSLILKSAATSIIHEYTRIKIFDSSISPIKRQIAFLARLLLYSITRAQSFERD